MDYAAGSRTLLSINSFHYNRGGADNVYFEHADLFIRNGWNNIFFSMKHPENIADPNDNYFVKEIDFTKNSPAIKKFRDAIKIIYSGEAVSNLRDLLANKEVAVAHVHSLYHHISPSILPLLKKNKIPIVLTAHDLKLACPSYLMLSKDKICEKCRGGKFYNAVANKCIKGSSAASLLIAIEMYVHKTFKLYENYVDMVVAPSRFYRDKLIDWGWPQERITHVPNFVPHFQWKPIDSEQEKRVVYFGRLSGEKGIRTLIEAAALSQVPVAIVGKGPIQSDLEAEARRLGAPVSFLGFRRGDALWQEVANSMAVCLPSEWYENSPLSVLESLQLGVPVIGARIGGIPELIRHGETGWIFKSGDARQLAAALVEAVNVPVQRRKVMASACRQYVNLVHGEGEYYNKMLSIYDWVVARNAYKGENSN